jgi:predicted short-subunit dehydrogenase-like oxidoreductase (DUF2520 family)
MHADRKKPKKKLAGRRSKLRARAASLDGSIAIIGAGRVGTALGLGLKRAGFDVAAVVNRRATHARKAARLIGPGILSLTSARLERPRAFEQLNKTSVIVIATPDDAIATVAAKLSTLFRARRSTISKSRRKIALHVSGALSSKILMPLRSVGFAIGSLHPLISISDPLAGAKLFKGAFFGVEGDPAAVKVARAMVRRLGGQSFTLKPNSKALYHAAAVTTSGHSVALIDIAIEMLRQCGLSSPTARQVLLPLIESTIANLSVKDPARALTGTFARGDVKTVARHLVAIESAALSDALSAYLLLGKRSVQLARKLGVNKSDLDRIETLLAARRRVLGS